MSLVINGLSLKYQLDFVIQMLSEIKKPVIRQVFLKKSGFGSSFKSSISASNTGFILILRLLHALIKAVCFYPKLRLSCDKIRQCFIFSTALILRSGGAVLHLSITTHFVCLALQPKQCFSFAQVAGLSVNKVSLLYNL